ncbi:MAG TPA: hypothetical protein PK566_14905 [Pseudobacteroides sp.]|nr:hypothetical protein [Pseudobacteroides sp.]
MKITGFKVTKDKSNQKKKIKSFSEKAFVITFFILFASLILTQILLVSPTTRRFLVKDVEFEGSPLEVVENLYSEGELELELQNIQKDENINVLINGDEVAAFSDKSMVLKVRDGDVLEIDGTGTNNSAVVKVIKSSSNIENNCVGKEFTVGSELKNLFRVKISGSLGEN